jgi:hypothetical protein
MANSVLAHVALRLTDQRENAATEALAFVLNRSTAARAVLGRLLGVPDALVRVESQRAMGEESRPDLCAWNARGEPAAYMEVKFWAGLTAAQPVDYLRRLGESGGRGLLFVSPERRVRSLFVELADRCMAAALDLRVVDYQSGTIETSAAIHLRVVSWSELLDAIAAEAALSEPNSGVRADVDQLRGLCHAFEAQGFIPLTQEELSDLEVPRLAMTLADLAEEIVEEGVRAKLLSTKNLDRPRKWIYTVGRYAAFPLAGAWIGLTYRRWHDLGRSPFWVAFQPSEWGRADEVRAALREWFAREPAGAYDVDGHVLVPLIVQPNAEKAVVLRSFLEQLHAIHHAMEFAGMKARNGAALAAPSDE